MKYHHIKRVDCESEQDAKDGCDTHYFQDFECPCGLYAYSIMYRKDGTNCGGQENFCPKCGRKVE